MKLKLSLLAIPLVGISLLTGACSKSEDKKPASSDIPGALTFSKPTPGAKLTRAQVDQIKKTFSTKSTMILPPGELIFSPKSLTPEEKAKKEQALKIQDPNSYDLLKSVQANCAKERPTSHVEATFPIDGEDAKKSIRAGDYMSFNASAGLGGSACAVDASGSYGFSARADERNLDADSGKASTGFSMGLKAIMKDPKFAKLLGARGFIVQSSLSGLVVSREVSKDRPSARAMIQSDVTGSYLSLTEEIPYSTSIQMLNTEKGGSDVIVTARLQMKDFSFSLDMHAYQPVANQPGINELYLNGYAVTQSDIDNLFGTNDPTKVGTQTAAFLK